MNRLPLGDPAMLASAINVHLRDGMYEDLEDLCYDFDVELSEVEKALAAGGFAYSKEMNKIR